MAEWGRGLGVRTDVNKTDGNRKEPFVRRINLGAIWAEFVNLFLITVGIALAAAGYAIFQVPFNISAGGIGGLSIVVNHFTGVSVGLLYGLLNVPLLVLGFYQLGRWRFLMRTLVGVALFSLFTDLFLLYVPHFAPAFPITQDRLLTTIYGGIVGGIGGGLIYRAGATAGGTGILGRVIQLRTGVPLSQVYLYTDGLIVVTMGIVFGWEIALYSMLALFLNGLASDYALEGPSSVRTAMIVTDRPDALTTALMEGLARGVSRWPIQGGYTGQTRHMLLCTVYRPQVQELKRIVAETDEQAFLVIGDAHQALGAGFVPLKRRRRRG
uniref:YitT family protein n=1 Tax=Litorilinea aerophila TaxID=1204385 RepID=A0A540VH48_9CHLR